MVAIPEPRVVNRALTGVASNPWPRTDWYEQAECRNRDSRLWFTTNRRGTQLALQICSRCEVAATCLALAIDRPELVGVWGGTDEDDRARLRRARREQVPG